MHLVSSLSIRKWTIWSAKVLSRTIYIAQILPCPANSCPKILSAIVKFIWLGKIEKPQRCVVFRKIPEGGLSLTEPSLFYKALFLCPYRTWKPRKLSSTILDGLFSPEAPPKYLQGKQHPSSSHRASLLPGGLCTRSNNSLKRESSLQTAEWCTGTYTPLGFPK